MEPETRCRVCGNAVPTGASHGLCPGFLVEHRAGKRPVRARRGTIGDCGHERGGWRRPRVDSGAAGPGAAQVLLRDTTPGEGPSPIVRPSSSEMPASPGRLQIIGEIAEAEWARCSRVGTLTWVAIWL